MLRLRLNFSMLGLLLAAATLLPAADAAAGTFTVSSCTQSPSYSRSGWAPEETAGSANGTPYFYDAIDCTSYGYYRRFEINTIAGGAYSSLTWNAPADTWIDHATLVQSITARSAGAYDAVYAQQTDGSSRLLANYLGSTSAQVGTTTYYMPAASARTAALRTELGCQMTVASCAGTAGGQYGNVWDLYGATFTLVDPSLPAFGSVTGAGWSSTPPDGVSPVAYSVSDTGAGLTNVRFQVDGIDQAANTSICSAGAYVPCPLTATGQFMLDTTRLSEGSHTIGLIARDYSGNETATTDKQLTITVRRAPASSSSSPVTTSNPGWNGGGSPAVGDQLTGDTGSWTGSDNSYAYQWMRCDSQGLNCVAISGATGTSYTPTTQDLGSTLVFCVTASNSGGSATSCSAPTPVVIAAHPTTSSSTTDTRNSDTSATPTSFGAPQPTSGSNVSTARGTPNGSPASDRVVLTAIANNRSSTLKVKYGKRVRITGRLVNPSGSPIARAVLTVQSQTAVPGASLANAGQIVTDSDGRFSYLVPVGPSRTIRIGYRSYNADAFFADTSDVRVLVNAGVTMKATPKKVHNKHATVFTGRLLGKPLAKRGVIVDLQVFFRHAWHTFAAPRANRRGVYRFKYRFMAGAATWRFRARVRRESSYPYELGYSQKPVRVRVVG